MKSLLLTLMAAAMPLMAQEAAPAPQPAQPCPCHKPHFKHILAKFDANKDGQLDDQEKAAMKEAFEARKAEFEKKILEKFDANKDGQLDDQEKAAMKAEFAERRGPRHRGHGPAMRSPRRGGCCGAPGPQGRRPAPQGCPCCAPPPAPDPAQD